MKNETIVDQIVRSLSFEVIAVPQNIVQPENTSKLTPVNVKIRVRKKNDSGLRHGVLSMPKVEGKSDIPERIRLVSSDQTIVSFNVVMEGEFDTVASKHRQQNLNMIAPGLDINSEDDNYTSLSKNVNSTSLILSKRNKDIFGACKPGGCLDPPFGEEKYSYQPAPINLRLSNKDNTAKLKTSSIFKNTLFKRRKKSSQDNQLPDNISKTAEADSILSLYESGSQTLQSPTTYSNSIITYPHISDSSELRLQAEKLNKKRNSNEDKSRSSVIEGNGSYFVIPKKAKNLSNQSDSIKIPQNYVATRDNSVGHTKENLKIDGKNSSKPPSETEDNLKDNSYTSKTSTSEYHELNYNSKIDNFVPVPLFTVLTDSNKNTVPPETKSDEKSIRPTPENTTDKIKFEQTELINSSTSLVSYKREAETVPTLPEIQTLNYTPDVLNSSASVEKKINAMKEGSLKYSLSEEKLKSPHSNDGIQNELLLICTKNCEININKAKLSKTNQNIITVTKPSKEIVVEGENNNTHLNLQEYKNNLSVDLANKEIKSRPLVSTTEREKSLLNVTTDNSKPVLNLDYSTEELKYIWKNDTEPLKSVADVIVPSSSKSSEKNINTSEENQIIQQHDTTIYNDTSAKLENFNFETSMLENKHLNDEYVNPLEKKLEHKTPYISQENISPTELTSQLTNFSEPGDNKNNHEIINKKGLLESIEKLLITEIYLNDEQKEPPMHDFDQKKITTHTDTLETSVKALTRNNLKENLLLENVDGKSILEIKNSVNEPEKSSNLNFENVILKQQADHCDEQNELSQRLSNLNMSSEQSVYATDDVAMNIVLSEKSSKVDVRNVGLRQERADHPDHNIIKSVTNEVYGNSFIRGFSEKEDVGSDMMRLKNCKNVSSPLLSDQENVLRGTASTTAFQSKENLQNSVVNNLLNNVQGTVETIFDVNKSTAKKTSPLLLQGVEADLQKQRHPLESAEKTYKSSQPKTILRKKASWKMDIALEYYIDENDERIIRSFNSKNLPERRKGDALLVAQCDIGSESNEIKIPIDHNNDLCVQIKNNRNRNRSNSNMNDKTVTIDELYRKRKMQMDCIDASADNIDNEDVNKSEANTHSKMINDDIRDVLITVYEQELVPLQDIIKGLREEIDMMSAYQMRFKEKVQKLSSKRSRPLRLVGNKKCACVRKM